MFFFYKPKLVSKIEIKNQDIPVSPVSSKSKLRNTYNMHVPIDFNKYNAEPSG